MTTTEPTEKKWRYQNDRVILVPYVSGENGAGVVFGPDILVRLWAMCERDHLMPKIFSGQEMTLNRFVSYLSQRPLLIGLVNPPLGSPSSIKSEIAGFAWLWGVEGEGEFRKAMVGFAFFRPFWKMPEVRQLVKLGLQWWFEELKIGVLFGTILISNGIACAFARKFGFKKIARIPNFYCRKDGFDDVLLVTLTRNQYFETLGREVGHG